VKTLRDIRRVSAGNPREAGRKRLERAVDRVCWELSRLRGPAVHGDEDMPGAVADLRRRLAEIDDSSIPDDDNAGRLLRNVADLIAELGAAYHAVGVHDAAEPERWKRQMGGASGGGKGNKALAEIWQKNATPTYLRLRAKFPKASASDIANRVILELGSKVSGKRRVQEWVGTMDGERRGG
jgi:hypothetical protein